MTLKDKLEKRDKAKPKENSDTKKHYQPCIVYLILMKDIENDDYYLKVGYTTTTVKKRYYGLKGYSYTILKEIKCTTTKQAYFLEQSILKDFRRYKVSPKVRFTGETELIDYRSQKDLEMRFEQIRDDIKKYYETR